MTEQDALVEQVLADYQPIGDVPGNFAEYVQQQIVSRPSPAPPPDDPLVEVNRKLDAILTLLQGGNPP